MPSTPLEKAQYNIQSVILRVQQLSWSPCQLSDPRAPTGYAITFPLCLQLHRVRNHNKIVINSSTGWQVLQFLCCRSCKATAQAPRSFRLWDSKNLAGWVRSPQPSLSLHGAAGTASTSSPQSSIWEPSLLMRMQSATDPVHQCSSVTMARYLGERRAGRAWNGEVGELFLQMMCRRHD